MSEHPPTDDRRAIELEIEVPGTPDDVWKAIATGPGITSWYVPHEIEEHEGGRAVASFGPEPEMQAPGRVASWEPPRRIVIDGGDGSDGLAFEWLVEARDGDTCVVRLVNHGFLVGEEWDDYYDGMTEGWGIFLTHLKLHLTHFAGRSASASLPLATWSGPRDETWPRLTAALGLPEAPAVGERVQASADGAATLAGVVAESTPHRISLVLDAPVAGTAFIAAEGRGDRVEVSIWSYLYDDEGRRVSERDEPIWRDWLRARGVDDG